VSIFEIRQHAGYLFLAVTLGHVILISAQVNSRSGVPLLEAATEGARLRFRPVMMTSLAFILGLLPLVVAVGASQLARRNVGTPVFGGMVVASFIGIFIIPPLYVTFQSLRERLRPSARPKERTKERPGGAAPDTARDAAPGRVTTE